MTGIPFMRGLIVALIAFCLAACGSAEPFGYRPISEIPAGPGLFSGADGQFVIYRSTTTEPRERTSPAN